MKRPLEAALRAGLAQSGLALADAQTHSLLDYLDLMHKWTQVYNLTAVREPQQMLTHHLLDSLAIIQPLRRQIQPAHTVRLLDVGSGAGLPGVVLAICCPDLRIDCVDASAKKTAFIRQVAVAVSLPNLRGVHARVEHLTEKYDVITSRALASLADFTRWTVQALADDGVWMAMKGQTPLDEIAELPASVRVFHVEQLVVPNLDAKRCLVWMTRA